MPDQKRDFDRTDHDPDPWEPWTEGNCPTCDGTGEVCCNCDDRGCRRCIDGMRTCESCQGSGYVEDDFYDED